MKQKPTIAAVMAIRACADTMQTQAESLMGSLPDMPMDVTLRARALELGAALKDTSNRVMFELALLQSELGEGKVDAAATLQHLSGLDAAMMTVVAGATDLVDQLEKAAERDEQQEPAFVLVIDAVGILLQELERAKTATGALAGAQSS
jgi:1,6-anhydro-N-acetylmuramate kinase